MQFFHHFGFQEFFLAFYIRINRSEISLKIYKNTLKYTFASLFLVVYHSSRTLLKKAS